MNTAHLAHNEAERLAALYRYRILDTVEEAEFDDICQFAAQLCEAPVALVSMVDAQRLWFKSRVGLDLTETPRTKSFCEYTIHGDGVFEGLCRNKHKRQSGPCMISVLV